MLLLTSVLRRVGSREGNRYSSGREERFFTTFFSRAGSKSASPRGSNVGDNEKMSSKKVSTDFFAMKADELLDVQVDGS